MLSVVLEILFDHCLLIMTDTCQKQLMLVAVDDNRGQQAVNVDKSSLNSQLHMQDWCQNTASFKLVLHSAFSAMKNLGQHFLLVSL